MGSWIKNVLQYITNHIYICICICIVWLQQKDMYGSSSTSYGSPCAACKFLRRKCVPGCIFSPHFPPEEHTKFVNVHKIFGAGNVTKLLSSLPPHLRDDAVNSLSYEAEARVRDPVYGCVAGISFLQRQIERLQKELDSANASLIRYAAPNTNVVLSAPLTDSQQLPIILTHSSQPQQDDYPYLCPLPGTRPNSEDLAGGSGWDGKAT